MSYFTPFLGAVGTTQTPQQMGYLLLYYKLDFTILFNCWSQPFAYCSNSEVCTTSGMLVKNKFFYKRFRYHTSGSRIIFSFELVSERSENFIVLTEKIVT